MEALRATTTSQVTDGSFLFSPATTLLPSSRHLSFRTFRIVRIELEYLRVMKLDAEYRKIEELETRRLRVASSANRYSWMSRDTDWDSENITWTLRLYFEACSENLRSMNLSQSNLALIRVRYENVPIRVSCNHGIWIVRWYFDSSTSLSYFGSEIISILFERCD